MTVIAWDGTTLAADRMISFTDGTSIESTKIWRRDLDGVIYGIAGDNSKRLDLKAWFDDGGEPDEFPEGCDAELLYVEPNGASFLIGGSPHPLPIEGSGRSAIGNGSPEVIALMHVGFSSELAVQKVCEVNHFCGLGIDILRIS